MDMFNKAVHAVCLVMAMSVASAMGEKLELDECKDRASAGDADAAWQLGQRYESGDGVRKDNLRAVAQYRKAAAKNHAKACARLAELYETGKIVGKDAVLAAKYKALANGESAELATALAKTSNERARVDDIEVALDYIIGRNGKQRDAKAGVRLLYQTAKDKPVAQRVFVERWEQGDLDDGLSTLDNSEWDLIIPWFKVQYEKGKRRGGLVLGNEAYRGKDYDAAARYWRASGEAGCPRAWYLLGNLYWCDEDNGGGPKSMRSDAKAKYAYERCVKASGKWDEAWIRLGAVCLFGDKTAVNIGKAVEIFSRLVKKYPDDKWVLYDYGLSGVYSEDDGFNSRWSKHQVEYLVAQSKNQYRSARDDADCRRMFADWKETNRRKKPYVQYIQRAASLGCEPATKFMEKWNE